MKPCGFHRDAEEEYAAAAVDYAQVSPELGQRLHEEIERLIVEICTRPTLSNAVAFVWLPAFVLCLNRFQIAPEESGLASLFGPEFTHYRMKVRRWL